MSKNEEPLSGIYRAVMARPFILALAFLIGWATA